MKKSILTEDERGYWAACREAAYQRINETLPKVLDLPAGRAVPFLRGTTDNEKLESFSYTCRALLLIPLKGRDSKTLEISPLDRLS